MKPGGLTVYRYLLAWLFSCVALYDDWVCVF